jgi:uncharacterized protein (TIGR02466 family)
LELVRAVVLETAGDIAASLAAALRGLQHAPHDIELIRHASHAALASGATSLGVTLAQKAVSILPQDAGVRISLCEALLADGRIDTAAPIVAALCAERPLNQYVLALQATVWRLLGDARYAQLYDYRRLVRSRLLSAPPGFPDIESFMAALAVDVEALHAFRAHPFKQSVRGGSQLPLQAPELARPLVAALFQSVQKALEEYVKEIGAGSDPLRARNTGRFGISGAWSVRLSSGGYHTDHVHPQGWLSSACYIATPECCARDARDSPDHAGWLRLGAPGIATVPALEADAFVQPRPGVLVLFPAYVWHGVVPFESATPRLSVAFDAVPLPGPSR